jgi:hypothetical protein
VDYSFMNLPQHAWLQTAWTAGNTPGILEGENGFKTINLVRISGRPGIQCLRCHLQIHVRSVNFVFIWTIFLKKNTDARLPSTRFPTPITHPGIRFLAPHLTI